MFSLNQDVSLFSAAQLSNAKLKLLQPCKLAFVVIHEAEIWARSTGRGIKACAEHMEMGA